MAIRLMVESIHFWANYDLYRRTKTPEKDMHDCRCCCWDNSKVFEIFCSLFYDMIRYDMIEKLKARYVCEWVVLVHSSELFHSEFGVSVCFCFAFYSFIPRWFRQIGAAFIRLYSRSRCRCLLLLFSVRMAHICAGSVQICAIDSNTNTNTKPTD